MKALLEAAKAKAASTRAPLEVSEGAVKSGCMINPRGNMSPEIAALVFAILVAGNWCFVTDDAIVVATMDSVRGLPRPDPALPDGYPLIPTRVVLVASAEDVAKQLAT